MRICVVGAGAIGGYLAVELAAAGHDVTIIARGSHLDAIRKHGLRLVYRDGAEHTAHLPGTSSFADAGQHDLVIVALKAHQIPAVAAEIPRLVHELTTVLTRSEERRVGKEGRSRWSPDHLK